MSRRAGAGCPRSKGPQRRADLPRGNRGRLRPPPEGQKVLTRPGGITESQEDTQEGEIWGLGGLGASRACPRVPGSSPPPTRRHCRYRRHLVPGLLLDPEPLLPPARDEPRTLVPAPSGLLIGPTRERPGDCPIGRAHTINARVRRAQGRGLRAEGGIVQSQALSDFTSSKHQTEALDSAFLNSANFI